MPYKNSFIKKIIDSIHNNIDIYSMLDTDNYSNIDVYQSTGPDFVTNIYLEHKPDIHILDYPHDQFFGKYAKHNYNGSWK